MDAPLSRYVFHKVCDHFEPQLWRNNKCKHCFFNKLQHTEEGGKPQTVTKLHAESTPSISVTEPLFSKEEQLSRSSTKILSRIQIFENRFRIFESAKEPSNISPRRDSAIRLHLKQRSFSLDPVKRKIPPQPILENKNSSSQNNVDSQSVLQNESPSQLKEPDSRCEELERENQSLKEIIAKLKLQLAEVTLENQRNSESLDIEKKKRQEMQSHLIIERKRASEILDWRQNLESSLVRLGAIGIPLIAIKCGFLQKKNVLKKLQIWKKRFCCLTSDCLYYFKSPTEVEAQGIIQLKDATFTIIEDKSSYCFEACKKNPQFRMHFAADTKEIAQEWLTVLNRSAQALKTPLARVDIYSSEELVEKLFVDNFSLALSIVNNTKINFGDKLTDILINLFQCKNLVLPFIKALISFEIDNTISDGTLFRGTSVAAKFLRKYSMVIGTSYLKNTLSLSIINVVRDGKTMEISPDLSSDENEYNSTRLTYFAQEFLDRIVESKLLFPKELAEICHHLRVQVRRKFPSLETGGVGGFVFLRFFCPSIVNPKEILESAENALMTPTVTRNLILIAKCLQYTANNTLFSENDCLKILNPFILGNIQSLNQFLIDISQQQEPIETQDGGGLVDPENAKLLEEHVISLLDILEVDFRRLKELPKQKLIPIYSTEVKPIDIH